MSETPQPKPTIPVEEIQQSLADIAEKSARVVSEFVAHQPHQEMLRNLEELGINKAFMELGTKLLSNPEKLAEVQLKAWDEYLKLWQVTLSRFLGDPAKPVRAPARGDSRFRSEVWENNFVFDYIKQSYLIAADAIQSAVAEVKGLDPTNARKVAFFTRQYVDALAPTNFVFTNPEVLKTTLDTRGKNLLEGLKHLLGDLERGKGSLAISMTDYSAFELGRNVATTKGKVVFQNDLMQLLQFEPTTPRVDRTPLIICPPWINKYYILDLREKNSFIKWATDQGITVFVISWVNPDKRHAHKTFEDYMFEGPLAAMDAVRDATGEPAVNLIGYCLGGTLTACMLSYLKQTRQSKRVKSVTFFTTMIDFSEPGELGVFVDEAIVDNLEKRMEARGYLEGSEMAGTFNMLRDNDLIWSFVVNNYLLGKSPFPFDLLYWNSDSTRMPARMHTFYLRNMYIRNLLAKPGALELGGVRLDLSQVDTPAYFISTIEDHIAPWKSTYAGARLLGGPVRFVLGGSGHIAGIVNPPAAQKYNYWTNDGPLVENPDEWLAGAQRHEGSWWTDWAAWVHAFSGGEVAARRPGDGALPVLEDAPGSFAKLRLDAGEPAARCVPVKKPAAVAPADTSATGAPAHPAPEAVATPVAQPVASPGTGTPLRAASGGRRKSAASGRAATGMDETGGKAAPATATTRSRSRAAVKDAGRMQAPGTDTGSPEPDKAKRKRKAPEPAAAERTQAGTTKKRPKKTDTGKPSKRKAEPVSANPAAAISALFKARGSSVTPPPAKDTGKGGRRR
jgi:polyhydroxyalkanoate synthase